MILISFIFIFSILTSNLAMPFFKTVDDEILPINNDDTDVKMDQQIDFQMEPTSIPISISENVKNIPTLPSNLKSEEFEEKMEKHAENFKSNQFKNSENPADDSANLGGVDLNAIKSAWEPEKPIENPNPIFPTNSSAPEVVIPSPPTENIKKSEDAQFFENHDNSAQRLAPKMEIVTSPEFKINKETSTTAEMPLNSTTEMVPSTVPLKESAVWEQFSNDIASVQDVLIPATVQTTLSSNLLPESPATSSISHDESPMTTEAVLPTPKELQQKLPNFDDAELRFDSKEIDSAEDDILVLTTPISQLTIEEIAIHPSTIIPTIIPTTSSPSSSMTLSTTEIMSPTTSQGFEPEFDQQFPGAKESAPKPMPNQVEPTKIVPSYESSTAKPKPTIPFDFSEIKTTPNFDDDRSFWLRVIDGIRCSMRDCSGVLVPTPSFNERLTELTSPRYTRGHEAAMNYPPCPCVKFVIKNQEKPQKNLI